MDDKPFTVNTVMTRVSEDFARAMQMAAQQTFSGMWGMANVGMEPSDGSYPPDMDMD